MNLILHRERQSVPEAKLILEAEVAEQRAYYQRFKVGLSIEPFSRITNLTAPFQKPNGEPRLLGKLNKTYRWDPPTLAGIMLLLRAPDVTSGQDAEHELILHLRELCASYDLECMNEADGRNGRRGAPNERFVYLVWA